MRRVEVDAVGVGGGTGHQIKRALRVAELLGPVGGDVLHDRGLPGACGSATLPDRQPGMDAHDDEFGPSADDSPSVVSPMLRWAGRCSFLVVSAEKHRSAQIQMPRRYGLGGFDGLLLLLEEVTPPSFALPVEGASQIASTSPARTG